MDAPRKLTPTPPWASVDVTQPVTLGWRNGGTADLYELQIQRNLWNSSYSWLASGGTLSATSQTPANTTTDATATINANVLSAYSEGYKWRVRSREAATATWTSWSNYNRLSTTANPPTVTVLAPLDTSLGSNHTRVIFSFTDPNSRGMMAFRIRQYLSGTAVFDTGELYASMVSGSTYSYIIEDYTNLDMTNYSVAVMAKNDQGVWSSEVTKTFLATPVGLASPTITTTDRGDGRVTVTSDATYVGKDVLYQRVYRRNPVLLIDTLVADGLGVSGSFTDTSFPLNTAFYYVVEVTATDGTIQSFNSSTITSTDSNWYLVNAGVRKRVVVEQFSADHTARTEYLEPLGRTRSVAFKTETDGREGTISFHVLNSERADLLWFVYQALASDEDTYILSPHGDVLRVKLASPDIADRPGGDCTVTIKFTEVAQS